MYEHLAGMLKEDDEGYHFSYQEAYLNSKDPEPISLTIPLSNEQYSEKILFPFFDGLIPEGWLLEIAVNNWKLDSRDRMSILLATCHDCIGAVSVIEVKDNKNE